MIALMETVDLVGALVVLGDLSHGASQPGGLRSM